MCVTIMFCSLKNTVLLIYNENIFIKVTDRKKLYVFVFQVETCKSFMKT